VSERPSRYVTLDVDRTERIGISEAVLCDAKPFEQLVEVLECAGEADQSMLLTRLSAERFEMLPADFQRLMDYESLSATAFFGRPAPASPMAEVAVVTGGTSDASVAREAVRTLLFHGRIATEIHDVGVAGLWRLQQRLPEIARHRVVIAAAGMDAALPTVLAGLVPALVIAVPTAAGYGVAAGGHTALHSLLASCAPGLVVVNIDNGYGAACAALRSLT
jgi:NCAIR mutase (PurE)-related protein